MTKKKLEAYRRLYNRLDAMGFDVDEVDALCRIERTLSRWAEHECNGNIEREGDNADGKPFWSSPGLGRHMMYPIADRERGAIRRLDAIMARHVGFKSYVQGDPRGCALYIVPDADVPPGADIGSYYTRGIAVCV